ncbi:carbohydrate ABC transporter substrate-binding protein (CUT1 family) [Prauserella shujinwangii]|uniref:Carbohydrate ABC transporter substrate-binding protein (CUT1 family) n=1 Tax=Prauserella shujinwangii TaxID=1453103 RepID=A0A2T0LKN1_9PSEU|nr:sugar ABC transporter substrate-binding protein [Prauserella shujinwangii]PRX43454.1 carbohydrate ABC transporter substrate-binding protein (CUT1 family) [Prauserella shujinwangii]
MSRVARHLVLGSVAATAMLVVTACGPSPATESSGEPAGEISELDYYADQQGSRAWQQILDTCSRETGITINRQTVPTDQMLPKILKDASSRTLPDLVFTDNPTLQQIASTGALTPLTDYGISIDGYYDSIIKAGTYEGEVYGLAPGVNGLALIYNEKLLAEAGVEPPRTWQDLATAARKLSGGGKYGLAFSAIPSEEGTWQFLPFFWSNGAELSALDSPEAVEALRFVTELVDSGAASKSVLNWNQNDVADQFVAGNAAMMINGSWNLARLDEEQGLDYGVVPVPAPEAGTDPVVALGGEVGAIPATGADRQQAAAEVLKCILAEENMLAWDTAHAYVPSRKATAEKFARDNPAMRPFVTEVETARSRTAELGERYPKVSQALATALQAALAGERSPQEALAAAQREVGRS